MRLFRSSTQESRIYRTYTMPLQAGANVGHYQVLGLIGAGGMGEVYRATDTKLNRDVALKLLPPQFTSDPDRMERFQREAHVLASLNHPSIAAIYGLEESKRVRALVIGTGRRADPGGSRLPPVPILKMLT